MPRYRITNTVSAVVLGEYDANGEAEALDALAREAGYNNYAAACEVAPVVEDEILIEIIDTPAPGTMT